MSAASRNPEWAAAALEAESCQWEACSNLDPENSKAGHFHIPLVVRMNCLGRFALVSEVQAADSIPGRHSIEAAHFPAEQNLLEVEEAVHIVAVAAHQKPNSGFDSVEGTGLDYSAAPVLEKLPIPEEFLQDQPGRIAAVEERLDQARWMVDSFPLAAGSSSAAFHVNTGGRKKGPQTNPNCGPAAPELLWCTNIGRNLALAVPFRVSLCWSLCWALRRTILSGSSSLLKDAFVSRA